MSDIRALEYSTLRVPYEILNKDFRTAQKVIDRESAHVLHALSDLDKLLQPNNPVRIDETTPCLRTLRDKIASLNGRLKQAVGAELNSTGILEDRVKHLQSATTEEANVAAIHNWKRSRTDRLIVDYLLRAGYYETAAAMANKCGLTRLVNVDYARRWLSAKESWRGSAGSQLRRVMALLAFQNIEQVPAAYDDLLAADRWQTLVEIFWDTFYSVFSLPPIGAFSACLQCGLTALKTPHCAPRLAYNQEAPFNVSVGSVAPGFGRSQMLAPSASLGCPVCQPDMHALAVNLPYAHVSNSRLICPFSGTPMTEENYPMMLPNGWVYGRITLEHLAVSNPENLNLNQKGETVDQRKLIVTCPKTGMSYPLEAALRVYVM